jgi:phage/plasmid-like protein (TIGR03299 family)
MAANLALTSTGAHMVASLRQNPWHRCGRVLQDEVTGTEMLKAAGLDWEVKSSSVLFNSTMLAKEDTPIGWDKESDSPIMGKATIDAGQMTVPNMKVVYRGDTGQSLGVVGQDYEVFQNADIVNFFEGLVQGRKIVYETAGGLGSGDVVWMQARIPDLTLDIKGDEMHTYMLIRSGHGGNMSLACFPTTVRTICQNTIRSANKQFFERREKFGANTVNAGYNIKHTKNMREIVAQVQSAYQACFNDLMLNKEMYDALADVNFTTDIKNKFFEFMVDPSKDESAKAKEISKRAETRRNNKIDEFEKILASPTNQTGTKGTMFSLLQIATEYVDHYRGTRLTDDSMTDEQARFESANFGSGDAIKAKALDKILELAGV